jgi:integrase
MLNGFQQYEPELCNKPLRDLTLRVWQGWVDRMFVKGWSGKPLKKTTIDRYLNPIKHIYKIAPREFNLPVVYPFKGLNFGPKRNFQHRKRLATNEEIQNLIHVASLYDIESCALWNILIMTALTTAMRRGELLKIDWRDIDLERKTIEIRAEIAKNGEARTLPIITWLAEYLQNYYDWHIPEEAKKPTSKVFGPTYGPDVIETNAKHELPGALSLRVVPIRKRKRKAHPIHGLTENACGLGWQELCERAGVPHGLDENGNEVPNALHFHDLRHTALTSFDRMEPRELSTTEREYMGGHGGGRTSDIYCHAGIERIRGKLEEGFNWKGYAKMLSQAYNPFMQEFFLSGKKPHWVKLKLSDQSEFKPGEVIFAYSNWYKTDKFGNPL